jgi:hypothetical protein
MENEIWDTIPQAKKGAAAHFVRSKMDVVELLYSDVGAGALWIKIAPQG